MGCARVNGTPNILFGHRLHRRRQLLHQPHRSGSDPDRVRHHLTEFSGAGLFHRRRHGGGLLRPLAADPGGSRRGAREQVRDLCARRATRSNVASAQLAHPNGRDCRRLTCRSSYRTPQPSRNTSLSGAACRAIQQAAEGPPTPAHSGNPA
jgi:hypothetical protein